MQFAYSSVLARFLVFHPMADSTWLGSAEDLLRLSLRLFTLAGFAPGPCSGRLINAELSRHAAGAWR